jgi:hypothetical protein
VHAAANRDRNVALADEFHGGFHVDDPGTDGDDRRMRVSHSVPYPARPLVAGVAGSQQFASKPVLECLYVVG